MEGPWRESAAASVVDVMLDVDVQTYLPDDLLVKMDIATMASSLEARSPLLDHELMEFAATLPGRAEGARAREEGRAARARCAAGSPTRSWTRPSAASVCRWATGSAVSCATTRATCCSTGAPLSAAASGSPTSVSCSTATPPGVQDHSQGIWTLLMFELWHQEFVDVAPRQRDAAQAGARAG